MTPDDSEPTKPRGCPRRTPRRRPGRRRRAPPGRSAAGGGPGGAPRCRCRGRWRRFGRPTACRRRTRAGSSSRRRPRGGGQDRAVRVDDHPGAESGAVPFRRRAARLDLDERGQDLLVDDRRGRRRGAQVLDRLVDDARCDRPDVAAPERGLRRAARRKAEGPECDHEGESRRDREPGAAARSAAPGGRLVGCRRGGRRLAWLSARRHPWHAREPDPFPLRADSGLNQRSTSSQGRVPSHADLLRRGGDSAAPRLDGGKPCGRVGSRSRTARVVRQ